MRPSLLFACMMSCVMLHGQVHVDAPLQLTAPDPAQRQLTGLPAEQSPDAVLTAGAEQQGAIRYAATGAGAVWEVFLPSLVDGPVPGTQAHVQVPALSTGPVLLRMNGHGPFALVHAAADTVRQDGLQPEELLSVVFDGDAFHLLNGRHDLRRTCPAGMVAVNEQFCVEQAQRPAAIFQDAAIACVAAGRRLCYWGELHAACADRAQLGITTSNTNWEWTNNTANSPNQVRRGRYTNAGSAQACYSVDVGAITSPVPFRCCYTR